MHKKRNISQYKVLYFFSSMFLGKISLVPRITDGLQWFTSRPVRIQWFSEVFYCLVFAGGKQIDSKKACFVSSNSFWCAIILFVWLVQHQNDLKKKCMYAAHDMNGLYLEILVVRPLCLYSSHELWLNIRRADRLTRAVCSFLSMNR